MHVQGYAGQQYPPQQAGYYAQPVVQQPSQTSHTTVVVNQQAVQRAPIRTWSSGMCGCFDDCGICKS